MSGALFNTECPVHSSFTIVSRCAHLGDAWIAEQVHGNGHASILFHPPGQDDARYPFTCIFYAADWDKYHQALMDGSLWTGVGAHDCWEMEF